MSILNDWEHTINNDLLNGWMWNSDSVVALISSNWLVCEIAYLHMMKGR